MLIPAGEPRHIGHMVRAVQDRNCDWYRDFCGEHPSNKRYRGTKFQTKIKRARTVEALEELIAGKVESEYAKMLRSFIRRRER